MICKAYETLLQIRMDCMPRAGILKMQGEGEDSAKVIVRVIKLIVRFVRVIKLIDVVTWTGAVSFFVLQ